MAEMEGKDTDTFMPPPPKKVKIAMEPEKPHPLVIQKRLLMRTPLAKLEAQGEYLMKSMSCLHFVGNRSNKAHGKFDIDRTNNIKQFCQSGMSKSLQTGRALPEVCAAEAKFLQAAMKFGTSHRFI